MKEKVTLNRKEQKRLMKKRCPDIIRAGGLGVPPGYRNPPPSLGI
jgi:hypothetical protein